MWQEKRKNGYTLVGLKGHKCRVDNFNSDVVYEGTYAECMQWLKDRACW